MRSLFGEPLERPNRLPVVAVVGVRAAVTRIEVEEPREVAAVRMRNGRPIVDVRTGMVERSPVAVTGTRQKDTRRSIITFTFDNISIYTIHRCPSPITPILEIFKLLSCRDPPGSTPMLLCRIMLRSKNAIRCYPTFALQS